MTMNPNTHHPLKSGAAKVAVFALTVWLANATPIPAADASLSQAFKLYSAGNFASALPLLQKANADHPDEGKIHYYLANSFLGLKDYGSAVKEFNTCIKVDPKSDSANYSRMALLNFAGYQPVEDRSAPDPSERVHNKAMVSAIKSIKQQADG